MPRTVTRRATAALLAAAVALPALTGCDTTAVTRDRVNAAVAPTFANLYVLQQQLRGRKVAKAAVKAHADCARGTGPDASTRGAGDDWTCTLSWFNAGPAVTATANYQLHVQPNGCYTADGDGPSDLNGTPTLTAADGATVTNPLWRFDGCFDIS
ncbi:hypothetical protein [Actinomadura harenae]|uniref:hypothetical protein n=1 Tax=Actinomadura harenae TaxID=2483351 RepID=UPI0011C41CAB|nr:hypothetical protein [Actinomadura harenae]